MSDKLLEAIGGISEQFIAECDDYISQRKASHRRRKLTRVTALCAAVIAGAALLTGAVYSIFRVSFPNSFANRTEHSAAIYDIEPFRMSIQLPAGCVIEKSENAQGGWSPMDIKLTGVQQSRSRRAEFLLNGIQSADVKRPGKLGQRLYRSKAGRNKRKCGNENRDSGGLRKRKPR